MAPSPSSQFATTLLRPLDGRDARLKMRFKHPGFTFSIHLFSDAYSMYVSGTLWSSLNWFDDVKLWMLLSEEANSCLTEDRICATGITRQHSPDGRL